MHAFCILCVQFDERLLGKFGKVYRNAPGCAVVIRMQQIVKDTCAYNIKPQQY